ncbi:MAG: signal transduction histidine kinase [Paenibacillus sp.]|jgi:diguanylate cyclase (GGDEF)-like protein|nr:signal transduction histidine kinase [Paenibacillus sp.]
MIYRILIPIYLALVLVSSNVLEKSVNLWLTMASGVLFLLVYALEIRYSRFKYLRFALLALVHWTTSINWILPLYLLLLGRDSYPLRSLRKCAALWFLYIATYSLIRFTYSPVTSYNLLVTVYDMVSFGLAIYISNYLFKSETRKESLDTRNRLLSTHDALTGLLNYEEYHRQVEHLIRNKTPLILVIIDCTDLKSTNSIHGFAGGDRILKEIADLLKIVFSDAYLIARYGGDEFALVTHANHPDQRVTHIHQLLESEIPKLTGVQITYGFSLYPTDGTDKEQLIHAAEKMLFAMKSEIWMKRENHMVRSEKLRVVGELASGMAHEIRNPLTTVKGFLQISRSNKYNIEPWYDLIMDEINRMSELTAEFLQFSKPHVAHFKIRPVHLCIQRVISLMESESVRLGHQINYIPEHPELEMLMDPDKLVQLLLNLVKNSFEAMSDEGTVAIRLYSSEQYVVIEIQDTGKGIPEAEMDKVFHPFYTTKDNGTGLGLSICHKIVQDHGGSMEVESKVHSGTTFRLMLPQTKQPVEEN